MKTNEKKTKSQLNEKSVLANGDCWPWAVLFVSAPNEDGGACEAKSTRGVTTLVVTCLFISIVVVFKETFLKCFLSLLSQTRC